MRKPMVWDKVDNRFLTKVDHEGLLHNYGARLQYEFLAETLSITLPKESIGKIDYNRYELRVVDVTG